MSDKYYSGLGKKSNVAPFSKNIRNNSDNEYSDNFGIEDDEFTDETITSDDIRMIGSNKPSNVGNNNYGNYNYQMNSFNPSKASAMPSAKYDVNNPSYRISGGFNSLNKTSSFGLGDNNFKSSTMYGGLHSTNNNLNKAYDPYSNININQNYSSAGFKSDRDKYNIDIDIKKYDDDKDKKDNINSKNNVNNNKPKETSFNYNYNLNNYNSNLNYSSNYKKEIEKENNNNISNDHTSNNKVNGNQPKKKKKDFFDDLDNQLKKDKLNSEYDDEFGLQLQNTDNDHLNIKSAEADSDDLKEITNINKELESMSNSKDLNEASLKKKSKLSLNKNISNKLNSFKNSKVSEEEDGNKSVDDEDDESSINQNLYNIKKKKKGQKFSNFKNDSDAEIHTNNSNENAFHDDLNSYRQTEDYDKSNKYDNNNNSNSNNIKKNENHSKKSAAHNLDTNEDYHDSTISINAYMENTKNEANSNREDKSPKNNLTDKTNNINNNKKRLNSQIQNKNPYPDIEITHSNNDLEYNNFSSSYKSKSKKEDFDYDKFTMSQSQSKDFNTNNNLNNLNKLNDPTTQSINEKLNFYDPLKMEEYLKKSEGANFNKPNEENNNNNKNYINNNKNDANTAINIKGNNIENLTTSKDLSKNKIQNEKDKSSYNYSQDVFLSQEKKSEKQYNSHLNNKDDIESEYNHFDDFDSILDSIHNDSTPYKIANSNTNRDFISSNSQAITASIGLNINSNNNINNLGDKKESAEEANKKDKVNSNKLTDKLGNNNLNRNSKIENNKITLTLNVNQNTNNENKILKTVQNKTIEEKSEKSSDIHDSKENEKNSNYNFDYTGLGGSSSAIQKSKSHTPDHKSATNFNSENLIRVIIANEMGKYITEKNLNTDNNKNQLNNNLKEYDNKKENNDSNNDKTNLNKAKGEILNKFVLIERTNNFLLNNDNSKIKVAKAIKPEKFFKLYSSRIEELTLYGNGLSRKDIREMKLDTALGEERKKREFFEFNYNRQKELIDDLENKIRRLKAVEIENSETKKLNIELENKYAQLEKDLKEIKNEYDYKMRLVEERVTNRESKNETRKVAEMKVKYDIELDNLKMEIKEKLEEIEYLKKKCDLLEKENNKLSLNKITAIEINEKIRELQNENFIIHEKLNETKNELDNAENEKAKLEKKLEILQVELLQKQIFIDENNKNIMGGNKDKEKENARQNDNSLSKNFITYPENFFRSDTLHYYNNMNVFEQIYNERENNTQDILIQSYLKEIQNLQNEIKLIKNINAINKYSTAGGLNFNPINQESNALNCNFNPNYLYEVNYDNNEGELSFNNRDEDKINQLNNDDIANPDNDSSLQIYQNKLNNSNSKIKKNNYFTENNKNNNKINNENFPKNKNNQKHNHNNLSRTKASLNNNNNNTSIGSMNRNYHKNNNKSFQNCSVLKQCAEENIKVLSKLLSEKIIDENSWYDGMKLFADEIKLRDKNRTGELDLETYLTILMEIIKIQMGKYELIEIFNNFYKCAPNKIKASDLFNALVNNEPSAFFIQSDPGYLLQIEKKIIEYERIINDKEKQITDLKQKLGKFQDKITNIEKEIKEIKEKNEALEKEKQSNQFVFNEIMKNNYIRNSAMTNMNMGIQVT